jgi:hypothetical protein
MNGQTEVCRRQLLAFGHRAYYPVRALDLSMPRAKNMKVGYRVADRLERYLHTHSADSAHASSMSCGNELAWNIRGIQFADRLPLIR